VFLKHGTGHAFECLGWRCTATFIIIFFGSRDSNTDTLSPCTPKHVMWQRVFRGASQRKVRNLPGYSERVILQFMRWLLGWNHISSLHSADDPRQGRNSCLLLRSCFIGSCHVGVSKRFPCSICLTVYCLHSVSRV